MTAFAYNLTDGIGNLKFIDTVNGLGHKSGYWKCEKCLSVFDVTSNDMKMLKHASGECK